VGVECLQLNWLWHYSALHNTLHRLSHHDLLNSCYISHFLGLVNWHQYLAHVSCQPVYLARSWHRMEHVLHCIAKKTQTPETFYYNFAKIALISLKIGTHNVKSQHYKTVVYVTFATTTLKLKCAISHYISTFLSLQMMSQSKQ